MENSELTLVAKLHKRKAKIIELKLENEDLKSRISNIGIEYENLKRNAFTVYPYWETRCLQVTKEFEEYKNKAQDKIQELLQRLKSFEPENKQAVSISDDPRDTQRAD